MIAALYVQADGVYAGLKPCDHVGQRAPPVQSAFPPRRLV